MNYDNSKYPILVIIADGWNRDVFLKYLNMGYFPEIKNIFLKDSELLENIIAVFPSVSLASHTTILTGDSQQKHKIICHRWVNTVKKIKNFVGIDTLKINDDISKNVSTIFELGLRENSYSVQSIISRGAKSRIKFLKFDSKKILKKTTDIMVKYPNSVIVSWLPVCDSLSHKYGPYSEQVKKEMISVSKSLGEMINRLKEKDLYDDSKILFTSDHGFKQVEKRFNIGNALRSLGYKVKINSKKYIKGLNIHTNGDSVALVSVNISNKSEQKIISIAQQTAELDSVDFILLKSEENTYKVIGKKGISSFKKTSEDTILYKLLDGLDPLNLVIDFNSKIINYKNLSSETLNQKYPDLINQFFVSGMSDNEIDMIIMSKENYHFSVAPRLGYRFGYHKGSHGGPIMSEMVFPAIIHSNNKKGVSKNPVRSQDLIKIFLNDYQWN